MRISTTEITHITQIFAHFLTNKNGVLYLYGSRVDDNKLGGDIDLLLVLDSQENKKNLQLTKHVILARLKEAIGEQKIDLKIVEKSELHTDPFLQIIFPKSILLKEYSFTQL